MGDDRPTWVTRLDNFGRGAANMLTFGLADRFAGMMDSVVHGGSISENTRRQWEHTKTVQDDAAYTAGQVAGVVAPVAAGIRAVVVAKEVIKDSIPVVLGEEAQRNAVHLYSRANGSYVRGADLFTTTVNREFAAIADAATEAASRAAAHVTGGTAYSGAEAVASNLPEKISKARSREE